MAKKKDEIPKNVLKNYSESAQHGGMIFDERRLKFPQDVIDDLLFMQTHQAVEINKRGKKIKELEKKVEKLEKENTKLKEKK